MASPAQRELCCALIKQYFGSIVESVSRALFNFDQANVGQLCNSTKLHPSNVKKALLVLIKHQLIQYWKPNPYSDHYEYAITPNTILAFFRHSKYIALAKFKYGEEASIIIKNLLAYGRMKLNNLIHSTWEHMLRESKESKGDGAKMLLVSIQSKTSILIKEHYIKSSADIETKDTESQRDNRNQDTKPLTNNIDQDTFCQLNIDRFNRDIRDEFVTGAVIKHYGDDPKIGKICQSLLELSRDSTEDQAPATSPVSFEDLYNHLNLKFSLFQERKELEVYLKILDSDSNNRFIFNHGFHIGRGNMYSINVGKVLDRLVRELLGTIVSCRFGPKCCRIFRLLMSKKYLLSKQIEDSVMLPTRDVREYTYMLIKEGLVRNLQIPRTADYAPSKSLFIMGVEIDQVVLSIIDRCCKSMNNTILRHDHETQENIQLLDRAKAVQNLIKSDKSTNDRMDTDDNVDYSNIWDEYFSEHERQQLELIKKRLNTLEVSRLQIDDTLHQLSLWLDVWPNMQASEETSK